jgi:hypothetical protein
MTEQRETTQNGARHVNSHDSILNGERAVYRTGKISDEFADRLAALPKNHQVRAVVLPAPYMMQDGNGSRVRGEERQAILRESRTRTEETFAEIDSVLAGVGGQRLTECGNALGYIVVETTPSGVAAIAELGWVGTVMEDQAIRPVHQMGS